MINYPTFDDVNDPVIRAWNRLNIIYNMKDMNNNHRVHHYTKNFRRKDAIAILRLAARIDTEGYENVRREIIRKNNG